MGNPTAVFATQILLIVSGITCFQTTRTGTQNLRLFAAPETPQQSFAAPERPPQSFAAPQPPPPLRDGYEITATLDVAALPPDTRVPVALRAADAARFPTASKAKRACRRGEVMLNGRTARCGDAIRPGDRLELRARVNVTSYVQARFRSANAPFDLEVAFEDDGSCVPSKPLVEYTAFGGAVTRPVSGGEWEREGQLLRFWLDFPEEFARGDIIVPAGRVYFAGQLWTAAELNAVDLEYFAARSR